MAYCCSSRDSHGCYITAPLSVVLVFYLTGLGFSESQAGMLLTLTRLGDTLVSLFLTTEADRIGRRQILIIGAVLMASAGMIFATTNNSLFLVIAGTIGVISPSGNEVGPSYRSSKRFHRNRRVTEWRYAG